MMELFMAGGNYPVAAVPFPKEFLSAVQAEIETAKMLFSRSRDSSTATTAVAANSYGTSDTRIAIGSSNRTVVPLPGRDSMIILPCKLAARCAR
jgi:hypothetical protein